MASNGTQGFDLNFARIFPRRNDPWSGPITRFDGSIVLRSHHRLGIWDLAVQASWLKSVKYNSNRKNDKADLPTNAMTKKKKGNKTYKFFSQENSDEDRYSHKAQRRKRKNKHNVMYRNEAEDQTLRQYIESDGSKTIIDMSSDGNCLFRSLSDQIYRDHGNNHAEVRSDICDFLEAFEEEFAEFLVLDENESDHDAHTFDHYVSEMRKDGEWGGNLELVAAARLYR